MQIFCAFDGVEIACNLVTGSFTFEDSNKMECHTICISKHLSTFGGHTILRNVGNYLPGDTASHPKKLESSETLLR